MTKVKRKETMNSVLLHSMNNLEENFIEDLIERYFNPEYFSESDIINFNLETINNLSLIEINLTIDGVVNSNRFLYENCYELDWYFDLYTWIKKVIERIFKIECKNEKTTELNKLIEILLPNFDNTFNDVKKMCNISIKEVLEDILLDYMNKDKIKHLFSKTEKKLLKIKGIKNEFTSKN